MAIKNNGDIDAPLPQQIELPAAQAYADGGPLSGTNQRILVTFIRISTGSCVLVKAVRMGAMH
ncbi:hypothetical protein HVZ54_11320 [Escherichia coli]|nr:hypothetical protein [Escherichia coli]